MSGLEDSLSRYLAMRRGFGFKLTTQELRLRTFIAFMAARGADVVTGKLAIEWAGGGCGPATWSSRLSTIRSFARHLANTDPRTEIPPSGVFPPQRRPKPYIYSEQEIVDLLRAMLALPPRGGLKPWTLHCFFGLLAVAGLRFSEATNLRREDVDLDSGVLTIRDTKFGKTRLVPIDVTTIAVLEAYALRRDSCPKRRASPYFLVGDRGAQLRHDSVHKVFVAWTREVGLRGPKTRKGPRVHDLRHSYAVRTLVSWYRAGEDVERLLPVLTTFLGHTHTRDTYWYLTASPELMGHAAARLEARWETAS
ncbi:MULTISPECIES: tyrosine-type recombinase/integrase [Sphingomonas]|uniref:tyrosine-type recombinase/integrase n=1 Tax=Sphingomonas TaxID=13687 RepID=UPI0031E269FC